MNLPKKQGFTLVELLVVVVIIATLAALSFTVGPRMMAKAKASESVANLRQLAPLLASYAADHDMKLPAALETTTLPDGSTTSVQWNEVCLAQIYPDTPAADFKSKTWWETNKPLLRNPLFKETATPRGWSPLNPGYAINGMIAENLARSAGGDTSGIDPLSIRIALARIAEPDRTPLIAPCDHFHFRYDEAQLEAFKSGTLKDLLVNGRVPILFVDGHVEEVSPAEYLQRQLFLVPLTPEA